MRLTYTEIVYKGVDCDGVDFPKVLNYYICTHGYNEIKFKFNSN